ncbi:NtaA/DmoA family FMN-dependent monooxygenase [Streptomyces sp. NPDC013953]|uniref:NtaA/DmoA family FMN-dependent monooxygenase n=1 Tax=Streptomyces sp. NPDC013953 TaxID=3364868 RepID=UPI0036F51A93
MPATPPRRLHLNAFLMNAGHHDAAWRHPATTPERVTDLAYFQELARTAERGLLDSVFLADGLALWGNVRYNALGGFEPLTLLSALATATERIGLIATVSTTFNEPFSTARAFASLDHLSGGRAGWNIVTSGTVDEARNFGRDEHLEHGLRYDRAREFVDVAVALWDSWDDDAIVLDRARGIYADTDKVRPIDHRGTYFGVRGPLNVPRSPQGHPLLVQAGSSEDGKEFAARYAEAVFTAQQTLADAQTFYKDLKSRLARYGRAADEVRILPGICPVIGSTEAEARALEQELTDLQVSEYGLAQLSGMLGTDVRPAAGRPAAGAARRAGHQRQQEPLHARRRPGPAGGPHAEAADRAPRRRPRPPGGGRHRRADRRPAPGVVHAGRGRRVQHHAALLPRWAGPLRRPARPAPPGTRPVPHRVHRPYAARALRTAAARIPPGAARLRRPGTGTRMTGSGDGPDRHAAGFPDADPGLPDANLRLPDADPGLPDANLRLPDANLRLPDANLRLPDADPGFPDANLRLPDANLRLPDGDSGLPAGGAGLRRPGAPGADGARDEDCRLHSVLLDSYGRDIGRGRVRTSGARRAAGSPPPAPGNGVPALPITSGKERPS